MNQILYTENFKKKKYIKFFKIQLSISLVLFISFITYWSFFYNSKLKKERLSNVMLNNFNIEHLYSKNQDYTTIQLDNGNNCSVIGVIEIPKINIKYPILSDISDELLKISVCRFYGPYPNQIGNLCIAAHNYDDNNFFSNLYKLNIGDIVNIYDINNSVISYSIYDKFEISENDTFCTNQNTIKKKEITLVTCNNINNNRLIVKARENHT